jgi:hypothetical protein
MKKKDKEVYLGDLPNIGLGQKGVDEIVRRYEKARKKSK